MSTLRPRARARQRGLSLVELMVGITVGLIVVAGASLLLSGQLLENRRLVAEAQVQQDLRATADIITRELRRAGAIGTDFLLVSRIYVPGSLTDAPPNAWAADLTPASGASSAEVGFNYHPTGPGTDGPFGFRRTPTSGVIQTRLVAGGWQDLTDPATLDVTEFEVARLSDTRLQIPCNKACPDTTSDCWPTVNQRVFEVRITARSRAFPEVVRSHRSRVKVRNDYLEYFTPPSASVHSVCPP